jgi:hypothetical protein
LGEIHEWALALTWIPDYPIEYYGSLLEKLYQQRAKQTEGCRFQDGDRLNQVIARVQAAKDSQEKVNLQSEVMRKYKEMKAHFERDLQQFDAETTRKIQQLSMKQAALGLPSSRSKRTSVQKMIRSGARLRSVGSIIAPPVNKNLIQGNLCCSSRPAREMRVSSDIQTR